MCSAFFFCVCFASNECCFEKKNEATCALAGQWKTIAKYTGHMFFQGDWEKHVGTGYTSLDYQNIRKQGTEATNEVMFLPVFVCTVGNIAWTVINPWSAEFLKIYWLL